MKHFELIERDGRQVRVYESGLELDAETGRIVKPAPGTLVRTAERSTELHRKRQEKYQARLRARLVQAARAGLPPGTLVKDSADVFAESGAMLFEQIVLESEAYPRDRIEAYEKLGKYAGVLPDRAGQDAPGAGLAAAGLALAGMSANTARTLARLLADVQEQQARVVDV